MQKGVERGFRTFRTFCGGRASKNSSGHVDGQDLLFQHFFQAVESRSTAHRGLLFSKCDFSYPRNGGGAKGAIGGKRDFCTFLIWHI